MEIEPPSSGRPPGESGPTGPLRREEILGKRIGAILEEWTSEEGVHFVATTVVLDDGTAFRWPAPGEPVFRRVHPVTNARSVEVEGVTGSTVVAVERLDDDFVEPFEVTIGTSAGRWFTVDSSGPEGVQAFLGVQVDTEHPADEGETWIDFWNEVPARTR